MNKEQNFLVRYGLHNFVTCERARGRHVFFIKGREDQSMICHATYLIKDGFGETTPIEII
ncbi:MAG: hypothetical protein H8E36_10030 [Rhodospirillaceae bacterium]|nr:hypothetical protein [Rhodospirillaceae bacterium]MBL6931056.1 hypothetical protein [Rhodospirillales bacterium]